MMELFISRMSKNSKTESNSREYFRRPALCNEFENKGCISTARFPRLRYLLQEGW